MDLPVLQDALKTTRSAPVPGRSNVANQGGIGLARAYRRLDIAVAGDGHTPFCRRRCNEAHFKFRNSEFQIWDYYKIKGKGVSPDLDTNLEGGKTVSCPGN